MTPAQLLGHRKQKDAFFKTHPNSPLTPEQQMQFEGLQYYDHNPDLNLMVVVTPFEKKEDVQIQTTKGEPRWYRRYGEFTFEVDGEEVRLTLYQTPHGFFLPFVDANASTETYPTGRYLDLHPDEDDTFHVDFNQAYNPFCAYNDQWVCPITPAENRLAVAILAGEKMPIGKWV